MRRKLIRIFVILLLLALPLIAWRAYLAHVINGQLTEIRSAGLPVNGAELNQWYATVPDNQNACLALTKAFELRSNFSDIRSNLIFDFKLPEHRLPLSSNQIQLLKDYIALNEPMLRKVDEALKLPGGRYPIVLTKLGNTPLPHLAWLKRVCLIHQYKAMVALESGEIRSADTNITRILTLANTLNHEPCLISQLVRAALVKIAFTTLERRANASAFSSAEASDLSASFARSSVSNLSVRGFVGERAMTISYFRMTRKQALEIGIHESADDPTKGLPLPFNGSPVLRWIGYYDRDYRAYLEGMKEAIELASNPPPENLVANDFLANSGSVETRHHRWVSATRFSAYVGSVLRENAGIAYQRLALTALAVERFRNQTGHLPDKLDQLTPQFLDEVPEDPFDGFRLRYKIRKQGYVIYSVGPDLMDDNGLEESDKKNSPHKNSYDITFTVDR